jgi:hypothetical protein
LIVTTDDKHYGDIADAIRDKLGTTDRYKPEDMAAAVGDIESGGGGAKIATGSFTQVSTSVSTPEITHNLGTKKIVCLCWIPNDVTVVPTAGYQIFAAAFINAPAFFGDSIQVDCTGYNSGNFSEVSTVDYSSISLGAVLRSPWTSQSNFTAPNVSAGAISNSTVTEDTLVFNVSSHQGSRFLGGYTYNYLIFGL